MMQSNCTSVNTTNNNNDNNNGSSSSHQACASCKHQRKKCTEDCVLAPHFPAQRTREFRAVHKVFGVSNVLKMVRSVRYDDRNKVADSLTWEALWRQKDPVFGPYGEYRRICEELRLYKSLVHHHHHQSTTTTTMFGWPNGNNNHNNNNKAGSLVDANGSSGGLIGVNNNGINDTNGNENGGGHVNGGWEKLVKQEQRQGTYAVMNGFKQQYYLSDKF